MFLIGVLPAFVTLWIRRSIDESALWAKVAERRRAARDKKRRGEALAEHEHHLSRFTLSALFADRGSRVRTLQVFLMSLTTTVGFWGISTWVPPYIASMAGKAGLNAAQWAPYAGLAYTTGSVLGYASFGFLADAFGRRRVTITYFVLALALTPVLFLWTTDPTLLLVFACLNAFFSNGQYTWMPVWLPELYPTRMRATAVAFAFNAPRLIAFMGPLIAGQIIASLGGFGWAAMTLASIYVVGALVALGVPETRGKPLPE
jgi:MFS family permease